LEDGLGDTIRVSLTEDPEAEIPVAKILVNRYFNRIANQESIPKINDLPYDPFYRLKRETNKILNLGGSEVPRVIGDLSDKLSISYQDLIPFGYLYSETSDKWYISDQAVDFLYTGNHSIEFEIPVTLGIIQNFKSYNGNERSYSLHSIKTVDKILPNQISFLIIDSGVDLDKLTNLTNTIFILETNHNHGYADQRRFFMHCIEKKIRNPIIIKRAYHGELKDEFLLYSSTDVGGLQIDGFGDGVWIESDIESGFINEISFGILQASRSRISKTEYISCPSCGRTLFDLQETTAKIRARTDHLKGIKIGVMGCIVNGPGEMADADYGYVGTGVGQISLYKGQDVVEKNIPEDSAVDQLIKLIESYGDWVEPSNV